MSEHDQVQMLMVSDQLLLEIEGRVVLDEYGRFLTWHARLGDGFVVDATISTRDGSLLERLRWALRPKRFE